MLGDNLRAVEGAQKAALHTKEIMTVVSDCACSDTLGTGEVSVIDAVFETLHYHCSTVKPLY